jgi:hypothetical protein
MPMARYLVVAHKTADSPELQEALAAIAASDPDAEFELLVPATPMHDLVSDVQEDRLAAVARAESVARRLRANGLNVAAAAAGDSNAVDAIRDHLREHPGEHALVIATLPPGISQWLRLDVVTRAERLLGKAVIHVVAHGAANLGGDQPAAAES